MVMSLLPRWAGTRSSADGTVHEHMVVMSLLPRWAGTRSSADGTVHEHIVVMEEREHVQC